MRDIGRNLKEWDMRKYITEFVGTFGLVLTVGCVVLTESSLAPLAIGGVLAALVFAGGHISGAHYNPAVTLAVLLRGRVSGGDVLPYFGVQIAGGLLGGMAARMMVNPDSIQALSFSGREIAVALVAEFLFTFLLAYVVLNVATSQDHDDNSFYGLAIGFTVFAGASAVGSLSGAAFNPAVAIAVSAIGLFSWSAIWIYLVANFAGGALAALVFRLLNPEDLTPLHGHRDEAHTPAVPTS
jgi:aquaporin Z